MKHVEEVSELVKSIKLLRHEKLEKPQLEKNTAGIRAVFTNVKGHISFWIEKEANFLVLGTFLM